LPPDELLPELLPEDEPPEPLLDEPPELLLDDEPPEPLLDVPLELLLDVLPELLLDVLPELLLDVPLELLPASLSTEWLGAPASSPLLAGASSPPQANAKKGETARPSTKARERVVRIIGRKE
jgi:hypothetical protein